MKRKARNAAEGEKSKKKSKKQHKNSKQQEQEPELTAEQWRANNLNNPANARDHHLFYDNNLKQLELVSNTTGLPMVHITESVESEKKLLEPAIANGLRLMLPIELMQNFSTFNDIFSMETWNKRLTQDERTILAQFLPPVADKSRVLQDLFNRENFAFGNDVDKFLNNLQMGAYHPYVVAQRHHNQQLAKLHQTIEQHIEKNKYLQGVYERERQYLPQVTHLPQSKQQQKANTTNTTTIQQANNALPDPLLHTLDTSVPPSHDLGTLHGSTSMDMLLPDNDDDSGDDNDYNDEDMNIDTMF